MHVGMYALACGGGQRATPENIPPMPSTFIFDTGSLAGLEIIKQSKQKAPEIHGSLPSGRWD